MTTLCRATGVTENVNGAAIDARLLNVLKLTIEWNDLLRLRDTVKGDGSNFGPQSKAKRQELRNAIDLLPPALRKFIAGDRVA